MVTQIDKRATGLKWGRMRASQDRFLTAYSNCGSVKKASRWAQVHRDSHYRWLSADPTYKARFDEAMTRSTRVLEDKAMELALDGTERLVLHNGKPVFVNGSPLMEREWDSQMIRFLLSALNRERYGEKKVIEVSFRDWDGDITKLSDDAVRGIYEIVKRHAAAEMAASQNPAQLEAGPVVDAVAEEITGDDELSEE